MLAPVLGHDPDVDLTLVIQHGVDAEGAVLQKLKVLLQPAQNFFSVVPSQPLCAGSESGNAL